ALSGGADSVSLLLAMRELSGELGAEICACHLNHGMRGEESDRDERFCRELCERTGTALYAKKIRVFELIQKHESTEEAARRARYGFFAEALEHFGGGGECVLATAHNANDNAETVLLNLTRGTGLKGLCGIPPVRGLGDGHRVIRPLIRCERAEIEEYLQGLGQGYVIDRTNLSEDYTRNKMRRRVLTELAEINPSIAGVIGRMTRNLRADSDFLEALAEDAFAETREGRGWNAAAISKLPVPVKARVVGRILSQGGIEPSALRIDTAIGLLCERSARFNPCKDRFFTIRKGICFVENIVQNYRNKR
ncbi:MAG: tRNA lysidine(34) synthetase TilS, partial [Oscillospiraceae bacterium]|nr:tRNA lysidine(34) synthetase TilS [Oscillospiraceae bacterium]